MRMATANDGLEADTGAGGGSGHVTRLIGSTYQDEVCFPPEHSQSADLSRF